MSTREPAAGGTRAFLPSSNRMRLQRERDTGPERAIRSELFRLGFRYGIHRRPLPGLRREADIMFPGSRVAVFIHGCFWHGCPSHLSLARTNTAFWSDKIATNRKRDEDTCGRLLMIGWLPMEIWEHEDPHTAAMRIATVVSNRCAGGPRPRKSAGAA